MGVTSCDIECFTGIDADLACAQVIPTEAVEAAGVVGWAEDFAQQIVEYDVTWESAKNVATMSMGPLCFLSVCWVAKCILCPGKQAARMRILFYLLSGISLLPGIGIFGFGIFVALKWREFQVFFTVEFIAGVQTLGLAVFFITGFGIFAVYTGQRAKQLCFCVLRTLEVMTLCGTVALAAKFAMDLDNMTSDTLSQAGIAADSTNLATSGFANRMADRVMQEMLSLSCRTYQVCCEDTELLDLRVANGAPRQCKVAHEGMEDDVAFILSDPSHLNFCPSVSGVNSRTAFPPFICTWVQTPDYTIEGCKQDYCTSGLQGLQNFLSSGVAIYRENMLHIGLGVSFLFAVQLVQLFIVLCMRPRRRLSRVSPDGDTSSEFDEDLQTIVPSGGTEVKTINVRGKPRLERRISVGDDLAFSGTYTGPAAAGKGRPGRS